MQDLEAFWNLVVDVWRNGVAGIDIGRILVAVGILLGFLLLRKLFTRFIVAWLHTMAARTKWELDTKIINVIEQPLRFVPVVLGIFFASQFLSLEGTYATVSDNLIRTLIAISIFWAFYRMVDPLSDILRQLEKVFTRELVDWMVKAIRIAVLVVGAATILEIWGVAVGPIIAGILIIGEKRFKKGDWIRVEDTVEGTVEAIGFRSTIVRRFDKAPVLVPNAQLSDSAVTNFSHMTHRRIFWKIGVVYSTTIEQLRQIRDGIEAYILENDAFASPEEVSTFVRIDSFNDSSIDIMLYCFTKTTVWGEWLEAKEALAYEVMRVVHEAGSSFAFPSRSLYVETIPGERPEVFVPPGTAETAPQKQGDIE